MSADPPLCGTGRTVQHILQCPLPRRGTYCRSLFEINEILDDVSEANGLEIASEWFQDDIDADDLGDLIKDFRRLKAGVGRLPLEPDAREEIAQRIDLWIARFSELEQAGSGLTGRYSDYLDV